MRLLSITGSEERRLSEANDRITENVQRTPITLPLVYEAVCCSLVIEASMDLSDLADYRLNTFHSRYLPPPRMNFEHRAPAVVAVGIPDMCT